ncbi:MAG: hypothetical protein RLZZ76_726 [Candidatus Parcubacteria bacterium]|jgi:hypothetical protein
MLKKLLSTSSILNVFSAPVGGQLDTFYPENAVFLLKARLEDYPDLKSVYPDAEVFIAYTIAGEVWNSVYSDEGIDELTETVESLGKKLHWVH